MVDISLRIPLFLTRTGLYVALLTTAVVLLLMPLSVLSYLRFNELLIPIPKQHVPIHLNTNLISSKPDGTFYHNGDFIKFGVLNSAQLIQYLSPEVDYTVTLIVKIVGTSPTSTETSVSDSNVPLRVSILSNQLLNSLNIYDIKGPRNKFWPITDDLLAPSQFDKHSFSSIPEALEFSGKGVFLSTTRVQTIYDYHNENELILWKSFEMKMFIPPLLKSLIPPLIFNYPDRSEDDSKVIKMIVSPQFRLPSSKNHLHQVTQSHVLVELASKFNKNIPLNSDSLVLQLDVNWHGARYYIYHHPLVSFFLGVFIFWVVSSISCVAIGLSLWYFFGKTTSVVAQK
ncbi:BA75_03143T0 [Komagataella pastoris]|uniref:BA75_03143T0 n=1 Tax=Komagataella pastoris TaxID=4922 RepID=A0A1B2JD61_PICPA|nr:BA75_03143T0 [Komagataella pastoris]